MLKNLKNYFRPKSLKEALMILKKGKGKIIPLGGGTTVSVLKDPKIEGIVDLEKLGLTYVKEDKSKIRIGATTTITEILRSKVSKNFADGILRKASLSIGSTLNRNMITVGGNIYQLYLWSSLPPLFLSLDAKIKARNLKGIKTIKAEEFFSNLPRKILSCDEIITEVEIDKKEFGGVKADYIKIAKTKTAYPMVSLVVILKKVSNKIKDLRISAGSLSIFPQRFKDIEGKYKNVEITEEVAKKISEEFSDRVKILPEMRASISYKREILKNLIYSKILELAGVKNED